MDEQDKELGRKLQGGDAEDRKNAASLMGQARTPRKVEQSRKNISQYHEERKRQGISEETRAKLSAAQSARWEREKQAREAASGPSEPVAKRPRGRPRKQAQESSGTATQENAE